MIKINLTLATLCLSLGLGTQVVRAQSTPPTIPLRFATMNLLNKNAPHAWFYAPWTKRAQAIAQAATELQVAVLGTQEGVLSMLEVLDKALPNYRRLGAPRSDSWFFAEYAALYIDETQLEILDHGDFWLSPTPEIAGSRGWDAANVRLCTWAHLRERASNKEFYAFNAHFDHMGSHARRKSAELVLAKIHQLTQDQMPAVFLGDLNVSEQDPALTILRSELNDTREASITTPQGPLVTYPSFGWRLDYIFTSRGAATCNYLVESPETLDGRASSDHEMVTSEVDLFSKNEHCLNVGI